MSSKNTSRLANVSANVNYYLNLSFVNPSSARTFRLKYHARMMIDDTEVPFSDSMYQGTSRPPPGNVTTARSVLGVRQDEGALNVIDAPSCLDLSTATCEGHSENPLGCSLAHKIHDCAYQSGDRVLPELMGCLYACNQSAGAIGNDDAAVRAACCGLQCLDSCWTRTVDVQATPLPESDPNQTICGSSGGRLLTVMEVSLRKLPPGNSGGVYVREDEDISGPQFTKYQNQARVIVETSGEAENTESVWIHVVVTPGAGDRCGDKTPWLCTGNISNATFPFLTSSTQKEMRQAKIDALKAEVDILHAQLAFASKAIDRNESELFFGITSRAARIKGLEAEIHTLQHQPRAAYVDAFAVNEHALARLPDLGSGTARFTDLVLHNTSPDRDYKLVFFASSFTRAGFFGRVGFQQAPNLLATPDRWPVGVWHVPRQNVSHAGQAGNCKTSP